MHINYGGRGTFLDTLYNTVQTGAYCAADMDVWKLIMTVHRVMEWDILHSSSSDSSLFNQQSGKLVRNWEAGRKIT